MKRLLIVTAVGLAGLGTLQAPPQVGSDARTKERIRRLNLQVLPKESGYLGIVRRSAQMVTLGGLRSLGHTKSLARIDWAQLDAVGILRRVFGAKSGSSRR